MLIFIPIGNDSATHPLKAIGGVRSKVEFNFIKLFLGVLIFAISFPLIFFYGLGLLLLLCGIIKILDSFLSVFVIDTFGGSVRYTAVPWEQKIAKQMVNDLN